MRAAARFGQAWTASLLPSNATPWELAVEAVDSHLVARDPVDLILAAREPATAPKALLPYLAMERSVVEFDTAWPVDQQRGVIAGSFGFHRVMGTRLALDRALAQLGYALTVKEWFELSPPGVPYTFTIALQIPSQNAWTVADFAQVVRIANRAKNAHTLLTTIDVTRALSSPALYAGGIPTRARTLLISQTALALPGLYPPDAYLFVAGVLRKSRSLTIGNRQ